jgi:hypothetical protein
MLELTKLLFDICLLKKAPQDLPYSIGLLKILLIVNIFSNFLLSNMNFTWTYALLKASLGTFLIVGFSWICLLFTGKLKRFNQTTCALLGVDALIGFFALPAVATNALNQGGLLTSLVMISLIIWSWIVIGHIIRNALDQHFSFSLGLAFLYLLVSYQVTAFIA